MASNRILTDRARLYRTLRSAHLERAHELPTAAILYRIKRYDFHEELTEGLVVLQARPVSAAWKLARSPVTILEICEPLMLSSVWASALAISALRLRARLGGRPATIVTYALENADPFERECGARSRLRRTLNGIAARFVWHQTDRIVFGTDAARVTYRVALPEPARDAISAVIPALPAPCGCPQDTGNDSGRVVFLGAFVPRKGLPNILAAWPQVTALRPDARLTLIGKGALESLAHEAVANDPTIELIVDPSRSEIHRQLRRACVLALPSQPTATWREQVGLPIVEGLAHGCRIVTTTETGLATWLSEHGHGVVDPDSAPEQLADAVVQALRAPRPAADDLPAVDGRLAADEWLFAGS
ncbi:glycosyltransferase family 4 protein [Cryobacterium sp. PH29-G1]|uniref:glycosyltransferase family 4 protein n=1 Tax=Cryobacterium sp. PH29-G1 TaxID=3046211 RepID=UPI0024B902F4|nr:glycosyltransferase family 4 protein [Cryobacterium sp. PH29-G1]MDJ0349979.1 glycosyltransferase family 4 protein [Cryobacterium sp. PH29-G1]